MATLGRGASGSVDLNDTRPTNSVSRPAIIRNSVVLPHPLGPSITRNLPGPTSNETFVRMSTSPKRLATTSTESAKRVRDSGRRLVVVLESFKGRAPNGGSLLHPCDKAIGRKA